MDEGRKRVLLIAASILAARKLSQTDMKPRTPVYVSAIENAIRYAADILRWIDADWQAPRAYVS